MGSIQRRLNAIAEAHKAVGLESPTHRAHCREHHEGNPAHDGHGAAQKAPALTDDIRAMVDATDAGMIGVRDRALILLGFAGAFRRSELVGLDVEDCAFGKDGLTVTLRRSKTDQAGAGRKIGIPYGSNPETCPVRTVQAWLEQAGITTGPLFRSINRHGQVQPGRLVRHRRGARGEEAGGPRGPGCGEVRRAFAAGRACHERGDCRSVGAVDHEPDRASLGSDGTALYPGWEFVPGEQRREVGVIDCKDGYGVIALLCP